MCEYCGCQDIGVIANLTREHDEIREIAREARRAATRGDCSGARTLVASLRHALGHHTRFEEDGLFRLLAPEYPEHVARLEDDHRRLDAALAAVAEGTAPDWPALLCGALDELFEHILREQDGLFPAALATLTPAQWEDVAALRTTDATRG